MCGAGSPAANAWRFNSRSEEDTRGLGGALAAVVEPGTIVALVGELGSGKTRLVQAIAEPLGVDRRDVTSPTFVLIHEYTGRLPIFHVDAYRLSGPDDFAALGVQEMFDVEGVCLIEWADRVVDALPEDFLHVAIEITGAESRSFQLCAEGPRSCAVLARLRSSLDGA